MEKLKMHSPDLTQENIAKIRELFPGCVTEAGGAEGTTSLVVDFDQLRQELSNSIVEGPQERYQLNWPGKREALMIANSPIAKTLRPARNESVNFEDTSNLFIEGDNLDALKLLQETYLSKVKMIYIDPPYNTGSDLVYQDDFAETNRDYLVRTNQTGEAGERLVANTASNGRFHSEWLSMIYPRLKLARNLLAGSGAIAVHIDENEYSNLEKVLAEVFGRENFLGTIVWDKRNPKGDASAVAQQHEYIVMFAKDLDNFKDNVEFKRPKENAAEILQKAKLIILKHNYVNEEARKDFRAWIAQQDFSGGEKAYCLLDDEGKVYRTVSMAWPNKKKAPDDYFIPLTHPKTGKNCPVPERGWRNPPATMKKLLDAGQIVFGADESTQPTRKYLLEENMSENIPSLLYFGGSDDKLFTDIGLSFDNPKPVAVAKKIIGSVCGNDDDVVLDFFAGSSTSAHATLELSALDGKRRKFIMVQLPEETSLSSEARRIGINNIADLSKERIRKAGKIIQNSNTHNNWNRDIGFRVLKIDTSNMADVHYTPDATNQGDLLSQVDSIKQGRTAEDLLFQVLVDWGVDLTLPIRRETVQGKTVFFVDENALVACFDTGVTEELVKELAGHEPVRVVFRDTGFVSDAVKINVEQIFRQLSPSTEIKAI